MQLLIYIFLEGFKVTDLGLLHSCPQDNRRSLFGLFHTAGFSCGCIFILLSIVISVARRRNLVRPIFVSGTEVWV